eukprot:7479038-Alexandrium_andersonii.AAC.1
MRWLSARREHVRVDSEWVRELVATAFSGLAPGDRLFPHPIIKLFKLFEALAGFFSVPCRDGIGATPASLRGGCATQLYLA